MSPRAVEAAAEAARAADRAADRAAARTAVRVERERRAAAVQRRALAWARVEGGTYGGDVSWPQCAPGLGIEHKKGLGLPMPLPAAEFVIVGLTNGPGMYPNPCLDEQVAWARDSQVALGVYAVTSWPEKRHLVRDGDAGPFDADTRHGRLANAGWAQAQFNVATMNAAGIEVRTGDGTQRGVPLVWMDVEPVPVWEWPDDRVENAAVVKGAARGYVDAGLDVGVYSTPYMWDAIVGDLSLQTYLDRPVPEWRPAATLGEAEALSRCEDEQWSIQGGRGLIGQWLAGSRDHNRLCPGVRDLSVFLSRP